MSTGKGRALRLRAAAQLGASSELVPLARAGLSSQRLSAQVAAAPRAAERALAAVTAVSGPSPRCAAFVVKALTGQLAGLARDLPALAEAFEHCLPAVLKSLDGIGELRPLERLNLVTSLERLMSMVSRSRHLDVADAMAKALAPAAPELAVVARQRPSPFICRLAQASAR